MACYLCVWKVNGVFPWEKQASEAADSWAGNDIERRWSVGNTGRIPVGSRIFLKTSGKSENPAAEPGLVCSGIVISPPPNACSLNPSTAVFQTYPYKRDGSEELDLTSDKVNFVQIRFDAILEPSKALPIRSLQTIGGLGTVYWNAPRSGVEIRPRKGSLVKEDILRALEQSWADHLKFLGFPKMVAAVTEEEQTVLRIFGREGIRWLRLHLGTERRPGLADAKRREAIARTGRLECEVCQFDFSTRYGGHGSGFMEVHHRDPLMNSPEEGREVTLADLALLCANCHRMAHRYDWPTVDQLRERFTPL